MCFLENKAEIFVNISCDTYYKLDFGVILNTKYLILHKNSNPKNLFSSPLSLEWPASKVWGLRIKGFPNSIRAGTILYWVVGTWGVTLNIKIKSSMTCVYKEYEVKINMVKEQWLQLKWTYYWIITWTLLLRWGDSRWANFRLVMGGGRGVLSLIT